MFAAGASLRASAPLYAHICRQQGSALGVEFAARRTSTCLHKQKWSERVPHHLLPHLHHPAADRSGPPPTPHPQVSVHPLMQHIPLRVLKARKQQGKHGHIPFATVVTDFTTCHNTWFHKGVDKCFVATEFAKKLAMRMGLKDKQVVVHGECGRLLVVVGQGGAGWGRVVRGGWVGPGWGWGVS